METKFKVGDKVKIIQRKKGNTTGNQDCNKLNGDVGKIGYVNNAYSITADKTNYDVYHGCFEKDDLELIEDCKYSCKFKIGDKLKIVKGGRGIHSDYKGRIITVTAIGEYCKGPGYAFKSDTIDSNCRSGNWDGLCGEDSFDLYVDPISEPKFKIGDEVELTGQGWQYTSVAIDSPIACNTLSAARSTQNFPTKIIKARYSEINKVWFYDLEGRDNAFTEDALKLIEVKAEYQCNLMPSDAIKLRVIKNIDTKKDPDIKKWDGILPFIPKGSITWTLKDNWDFNSNLYPENNRYGANIPKNYFEVIEEIPTKPEFIKGQWYYWTKYHKDAPSGLKYFKAESVVDSSVKYSCRIDVDNTYRNNRDLWTWNNDIIKVDIKEIQQYLPNGHVDKIKSESKYKIGEYVITGGSYDQLANFIESRIKRLADKAEIHKAIRQSDEIKQGQPTGSCAEIYLNPVTEKEAYKKEQAFDEPVLVKQIKKSKRIIAV